MHQRQVFHGVLAHAPARPAGMPRGHGEFDVAEGGQPRHQRMALEDHGAVEAPALDMLAGGDDVAGGRRVEPGEDIQDRRLAAAGVADHAGELALRDAEVHLVEDRLCGTGVGLGQTLDEQEVTRHT